MPEDYFLLNVSITSLCIVACVCIYTFFNIKKVTKTHLKLKIHILIQSMSSKLPQIKVSTLWIIKFLYHYLFWELTTSIHSVENTLRS